MPKPKSASAQRQRNCLPPPVARALLRPPPESAGEHGGIRVREDLGDLRHGEVCAPQKVLRQFPTDRADEAAHGRAALLETPAQGSLVDTEEGSDVRRGGNGGKRQRVDRAAHLPHEGTRFLGLARLDRREERRVPDWIGARDAMIQPPRVEDDGRVLRVELQAGAESLSERFDRA